MRSTRLTLTLLLGLMLGQLACRGDSAGVLLGPRGLSGTIQVPRLPPPVRPALPPAVHEIPQARTTVHGHVLSIPPGFSSKDGAYDLAIHFHGNPNAVEESYRRAGINAVVVVVNLGEGATRYVERFADPGQLQGILRRVDEKLAEQGLDHPRRRHLALSSWSAGYGAIMRVLDHADSAALVDAVLLLDGLHARRMPVTHGIDHQDLDPFTSFAVRASAGEALLVITHSDIEPVGPLVSADDCSDHVLEQVQVKRRPVSGRIEPTTLEAALAFYAPRSLVPLELDSVARRGGLIVRGYEGRAPEHHIAHLFQMETLVLDDLRRWWSSASKKTPGA